MTKNMSNKKTLSPAVIQAIVTQLKEVGDRPAAEAAVLEAVGWTQAPNKPASAVEALKRYHRSLSPVPALRESMEATAGRIKAYEEENGNRYWEQNSQAYKRMQLDLAGGYKVLAEKRKLLDAAIAEHGDVLDLDSKGFYDLLGIKASEVKKPEAKEKPAKAARVIDPRTTMEGIRLEFRGFSTNFIEAMWCVRNSQPKRAAKRKLSRPKAHDGLEFSLMKWRHMIACSRKAGMNVVRQYKVIAA